jgi:hypothetical protein
MALRVLVGVLLLAGCYQPRVKNGGFTCKPTDDPACPVGYYCVDGWCLDHPAAIHATGDLGLRSSDGSNEHDLSSNGDPRDLAGGTQDPEDLAKAPRDLAQSPPDLSPPRDMAHPRDLTPPADIATGMCAHAGTPCTMDAECCSNTCSASFNYICIGG